MPELADTNKYCNVCGKTFSGKNSYRIHLFVVHKINDASKLEANKLYPNVNDFKYYCCSCDRTLSRNYLLKNYPRKVHGIELQIRTKGGLEPDVDNPNNCCRVCKAHSLLLGLYRQHCKSTDRMTLPASQRKNTHPDAEIDRHGPSDHYAKFGGIYKEFILNALEARA